MIYVKKLIKIFLLSVALFFVSIVLIMSWTKVKSFEEEENDLSLAIRWEGFYHNMNHRDVGSSINDCLGERIFKGDIVHRSAGWFSGWSCSKVGNPDVIYSLNYSPSKKERFFCHKDQTKIIGRFFNDEVLLNDLEYIENWKNEKMRIPTCLFVENILRSVISEKRVLIHCDAGRDRSGTLSALLIAMAAEKLGLLNEKMIGAIECDYRKTESLAENKYGRMSDFVKNIQNRGGVEVFLSDRCGIPADIIAEATEKFRLFAEPNRTRM